MVTKKTHKKHLYKNMKHTQKIDHTKIGIYWVFWLPKYQILLTFLVKIATQRIWCLSLWFDGLTWIHQCGRSQDTQLAGFLDTLDIVILYFVPGCF